LLKKERGWVWSQERQNAFEALKKAIIEEPVLSHPDLNKTFELYMDAFEFSIGGVLMQEVHLIAFES